MTDIIPTVYFCFVDQITHSMCQVIFLEICVLSMENIAMMQGINTRDFQLKLFGSPDMLLKKYYMKYMVCHIISMYLLFYVNLQHNRRTCVIFCFTFWYN